MYILVFDSYSKLRGVGEGRGEGEEQLHAYNVTNIPSLF